MAVTIISCYFLPLRQDMFKLHDKLQKEKALNKLSKEFLNVVSDLKNNKETCDEATLKAILGELHDHGIRQLSQTKKVIKHLNTLKKGK